MKKELDLSIICCFNNKEQLNNQLLESYTNQNSRAELILIDNTRNEFKSAASALNYGASLATKNNYIFLHQDIIFLNKDSLEKVYSHLVNHPNAIIGIAGVKYNSSKIISTILEGKEKKKIGEDFYSAIEIFTLDECLIGCSKTNFFKFDEKTCDNWHLYAVDLCLQAHINKLQVFCVPSTIWHYSGGNINNNFYVSLKKLVSKYRKYYSKISTTCISVSTSPIALKGNVYIRHWKFKKGINRR